MRETSDGGRALVVPRKRLVGFELELGSGGVRLICDDGQVLGGNPGVRDMEASTLASMDELSREVRRRRPAVINVRPGRSGQPVRRMEEDPLEGLDGYGPIIWRRVAGGATVGTVKLSDDGNTILATRMSADDRNERLVHQLEPTLALCERYPDDLRPRLALFAVNMSGTREVRHERAGPPPPDVLERDDMLLVDAAIKERWLQHIVWRDGDRIARDTLPGEMLLRRWQKSGVGLWLSSYGRQMDYETDWMALTAMMMVSAAERRNSTRRLRSGAIKNGPLAGKGWLGPVPFGFVRDRRTKRLIAQEEGMRWVNRAFEVADSGVCVDDGGVGLSTRKVADELAAEGCPFDHERVRKLLKAPIYCTGEFYVKIGGPDGVAVLQDPPENPWTVPRDRFERVQNLLALRQGRSDRTDLGEFLFNYVESVHAQCEGTRNGRGHPARIKGYLLKDGNPDHRRLRHMPFTPEGCKHLASDGKALLWERDRLEPPVVEAVRQLVEHPEVRRQLAAAARIEQGDIHPGLSPDEREHLERQVQELRAREEELVDQYTLGTLDVDQWKRLFRSVEGRRVALEARLDRDSEMTLANAGRDQRALVAGRRSDDRAALFLEILSVETPKDPLLKALRARLFQRCVSRLVIDDTGTGEIVVTVEGPLVPSGAPAEDCNPVLACADLLERYADEKDREQNELLGVVPPHLETAHEGRAAKAVSRKEVAIEHLLNLPSKSAAERHRRSSLGSNSWRQRRGQVVFAPGGVAWRVSLEVDRPALRGQAKRSARTTLTKMLASGVLRPGEQLVATRGNRRFVATLRSDGALDVDGLGRADSLSTAARRCCGSSHTNGWFFWSVEREERLKSLAALRDEARQVGSTVPARVMA